MKEIILMMPKLFTWRVLLLGFAVAMYLTPDVCIAKNANVGSESGLDKAMQQNTVKYVGIESGKKEKINKAEEAAYKALLSTQNGDPATRIQVSEDFAVKFPTSHYLPGIYGILTSSY